VALHAGPRTPDIIVQQFFAELGKGQSSEAVKHVFEGSQMMVKKPQDIELIVQQINSAVTFYGTPIANELLASEEVSESLVKRSYLLKHENFATHWDFAFYRPHDDWIVIRVNFDDKVHLLSAK
jgi:hypothetical protein